MHSSLSRRSRIATAWLASLALLLPSAAASSAHEDDAGTVSADRPQTAKDDQPPVYHEVDGESLLVAGPHEPNIDPENTAAWGHDEIYDMTILVQRFVESQWPETHAGVWMDTDEQGTPFIAVATVDSVPLDEVEASIREEHPGSYPLEAVHHRRSFAELDRLAEDLFVAGLKHAGGGADRTPPDHSREARRVRWHEELNRVGFPSASTVDIDIIDNQISVWTTADLPRELTGDKPSSTAKYPHGARPSASEQRASNLLTSMVAAPVTVIENGAPTLETHDCSGRRDCVPNMIGGLGIRASSGFPGTPDCSTGFAAYGASGRRFAITAGHCIAAGQNWWNGGVQYGTLEQAVMGGYVDQGRIVWDANDWQHYGEIWVGGTERTRGISSYMRWDDIPVGNENYFIGVSAGRTNAVFRGLVDSKNARVYAQGNPQKLGYEAPSSLAPTP